MVFTSFASAISYFDMGFGVGPTWATLNNYNIGGDDALDFGMKIGGRPINLGANLYIVGELSGTAGTYFYHFINKSSQPYADIYSFMIGPGVIYYPIQSIQLGLSAGYSPIAYQDGLGKSGTEKGYAYNISVALDLVKLFDELPGFKGFGPIKLMGLKYTGTSSASVKSSTIGMFLKYVYRNSD
jgi:hypothetical protein